MADNQRELFDPPSALQIGVLTGLFGGSIFEAVLIFFVLAWIRHLNGRPANALEVGLTLGLMMSLWRFHPW
ncbi:MAG: hypothetical protein ACRCWF_04415 [Beijerinckiaceae bacterium]